MGIYERAKESADAKQEAEKLNRELRAFMLRISTNHSISDKDKKDIKLTLLRKV